MRPHPLTGALRLLDYRQLPSIVWDALLGELGIDCTPEQLAAMRGCAGFHAKSAGAPFAGDPPASTTTAPHLLAKMAPLYAQLETLRRSRERGA